MRADVGDRIVIHGRRSGQHDRDCEVLEVRDSDGPASYLVRWGDTGRRGLLFPGPDATVEHTPLGWTPAERSLASRTPAAGAPDGAPRADGAAPPTTERSPDVARR